MPLSVSDELSRICAGPIASGVRRTAARCTPCSMGTPLPSTATNTPQSNMQGYR
jgi:hypothetical protein